MRKQITTGFLTILALSFFVFPSCDDDNDASNNNCSNPIQLDSFPLSIGNSWKYHRSIVVHDSDGAVTFSILYDHYWTVSSDTIINGINAVKIDHRDSCYDGSEYYGASYFYNTPDGFYLIAQENLYSSGIAFKAPFNLSGFKPTSLLDFNPIRSDTIFIPDTAFCVLKFPSQVNLIWDAFPTVSHQKRKYVDCQSINTDVGNFDCMRVQFYEQNGTALDSARTFYLYYSQKGLISSSIHSPTTGNTGDFDGGWVNEEVILKEINF